MPTTSDQGAAHRAALLYSFATLLIAVFVQFSGWGETVDVIAAFVVIAYFLAAMIHVFFEEGLVNLGRFAAFTDGVDEVRALCQELSPEAVAETTGIPAATIRAIAREYATTKKAASSPSQGSMSSL